MTDEHEAERAEFTKAVGSGRLFAERIAAERAQRGWSQAELSRRMRAIGHPLDQAAISKIESPPNSERVRRIDIDEAIGFARVFDLSLEEMTLPIVEVRARQVLKSMADGPRLAARYLAATDSYNRVVMAVAIGVDLFPAVAERLKAELAALQARPDSRERTTALTFYQDVIKAVDDEIGGVARLKRDRVDLEEELDYLVTLWRFDD